MVDICGVNRVRSVNLARKIIIGCDFRIRCVNAFGRRGFGVIAIVGLSFIFVSRSVAFYVQRQPLARVNLLMESAAVVFESYGAAADVDDVIIADAFADVSAAHNFQRVVAVPVVDNVVAVARVVFVNVEAETVTVNFIVAQAAANGFCRGVSTRRENPPAAVVLFKAGKSLLCDFLEDFAVNVFLSSIGRNCHH